MESKLKAQAMDQAGERTEFTPSIINKRFPDFQIPDNAKVTAVKIGDKVATCVEELPAGYLHLPTKPIEISVKYVQSQSDAWNDAGTKPDHPCLCQTKIEGLDDLYFQYFNGEHFGVSCGSKEHAIRWAHVKEPHFKVIQWREVQP